jgi:hypothetical protein
MPKHVMDTPKMSMLKADITSFSHNHAIAHPPVLTDICIVNNIDQKQLISYERQIHH